MKLKRSCFILIFLCFSGFTHLVAQGVTKNVHGIVQDSVSGEPLENVTIDIPESSLRIQTDSSGRFVFTASKKLVTIILSRVGYDPRTIKISTGESSVEIKLNPSATTIEDVVVIGYTQQTLKKNIASVGRVSAPEFENNPNPNPLQALQGKVAGVSVPINAGQPGIGAPNIIIRGGTKPNTYGSGLGTNNGNAVGSSDATSPLVVVDGVFRSLTDVNPEDIATMQIMKDAASTAIYGARGANGVIVITTKKGKLNTKMNISVNHRTTWETQARNYHYLNAEQYLKLARTTVATTSDALNKDNLLNKGGFSAGTRIFTEKGQFGRSTYLLGLYDNIVQVEGQTYVDNLLANGWRTMDDPINPGTKLLYADNHYQDLLWNTGLSQMDNVSFSGGTDKADYNFSMGYTNQKGVFVGTKYQRYNALGNFGFQASKNLKFDFMINYQNAIPNYVDNYQNDLIRAIRITPLIRIYKDDGNPALGELYTVRNRFHTLKYDDIRTNTERLVLRVGADQLIAKGLHYRPSVSYLIEDYTETTMRKTTPADEIQPAQKNWKDDYTNSSRQLMIDQILQYNFSLENSHYFSALLGANFTRKTNHSKDMGSQRAANDYIYTIRESPLTTIDGVTYSNVLDFATALGESRSASFFGQFNYDYKSKYLFGASLRRDGFSNFAPEHKYGLFPSVSAGWNIDREGWWKGKIVNALKVRGSWGAAGLSDLALSDTYGNYGAVGYALSPGILRTKLSNPKLRWESTITSDAAIDASLFASRLNITVEVYNKLTKDRINSKPLPSESPFSSIIFNNGELQNRGIEIALGGSIIRKKSLQWETNISFAYNRTTITKLPDNGRDKNRQSGAIVFDPGVGKDVEVGGLAEGERPYGIWAFKVVGVFATDEEAAEWNKRIKDNLASPEGIKTGKRGGDFIFADLNNDGVIDTKDMSFIGYRTPDIIGGIQNTITYKRVSLRFNGDYALGHLISNGALAGSMGSTRAFNEGAPGEALGDDVWQKQGDVGKKYARFSIGDGDLGQRNYRRSSAAGVGQGYGSDVSVMYEKGDFFAFREVTLAYDLPQHWASKIRSAGINLSFGVYNLGYLTQYKGLNPEVYTGFDPGGYPRPRQFSLGANIRF